MQSKSEEVTKIIECEENQEVKRPQVKETPEPEAPTPVVADDPVAVKEVKEQVIAP